MTTRIERANYIAQCFANAGVVKASIMGIMANMCGENSLFSPTLGEYSGGGGIGLVQWTGNVNSREINAMIASGRYSEKELIKDQVNRIVNNKGGQYAPNGRYGWASQSWSDFKVNKQGRSALELTGDFLGGFERSAAWSYGVVSATQQRNSRYGMLEQLIKEGLKIDGGSGTGLDPDETAKGDYKQLTLKDCLEQATQKGDTTVDSPGSGKIDWKPIDDYFNKYKGTCRYSQGNRGGIFNGTYGDCSAFVSYMLELGLGLKERTLCNTESEHAWLLSHGYTLYKDGTNNPTSANLKAQGGDVMILGAKGTSLGDNGHTMLFRDSHSLYHCTGPTGALSLKHVEQDSYYAGASGWWAGSNWHWYCYRLKG